MAKLPRVRLQKGAHRRLMGGYPWVYSNEIAMDLASKALNPGVVVTLDTAGGEGQATAHFNPHTLIAARVLEFAPDRTIDREWFKSKLERALALRTRLFDAPYYRLVHAEGDGLPGLVIDRFGDVAVVQPNTAGMAAACADIVAALAELIAPRAVVVRGDSAARALEGLDDQISMAHGTLDGPVEVKEGGCTFFADLTQGQKTGWFFDQRDNRAFIAGLARGGSSLLDLYTHTGGFAVAAAKAGAVNVTAVDGSALALELAQKAAQASGVADRCAFTKSDVFDYLTHAAGTGAKYDIVVADPPAFVKSRKDLKPGLQGYRKLARLCAPLVAPGGFLLMASCSHNAGLADFNSSVVRGLDDTHRTGRLIRTSGAGADHPVHAHLPETAYLKAVTYQLD
ncbi:MAG: class I SAM-dependent rRNA methyltransferase [Rhodobacteraceae bacterium]|nr:class I SAM-dependent rRNA methyltransferase [Paracoccaceae bacterium]